jgi:hypothetical protein
MPTRIVESERGATPIIAGGDTRRVLPSSLDRHPADETLLSGGPGSGRPSTPTERAPVARAATRLKQLGHVGLTLLDGHYALWRYRPSQPAQFLLRCRRGGGLSQYWRRSPTPDPDGDVSPPVAGASGLRSS